MITELIYSQSDTQGGVNQFNFFTGESADIIGQQGFRKAYKIVTENSAVVFQPFFYADFNLGRKTAIICVDRCANDRGETLIDKR